MVSRSLGHDLRITQILHLATRVIDVAWVKFA